MLFERKIASARRWMWYAALANGAAWGLVPGVCASLAAVLCAKLALPQLAAPWLWAPPCCTLLIGALWSMARHHTTREVAALAIDARFGLKECFISALHASRAQHAFSPAIVAQAERVASAVSPRSIGTIRIRTPMLASVLVAVVAGAVLRYAPEGDVFGRKSALRALERSKVVVAATAPKLEAVKHMLTDTRSGALPTTTVQRLAVDMDELRRQFGQAQPPGPRDALARLSSLADKIAVEKEQLRSGAVATVGKLPIAPERQTARLERALRRGDTDAAREEIKRLAQKAAAASTAGTSETAELGRELASLGQAVDGQENLAASLARAGEALQRGEAANAGKALDDAAQSLTEMDRARQEIARSDEALDRLDASKRELAEADESQNTQQPSEGTAGQAPQGQSNTGEGSGQQGGQQGGALTGQSGQSGAGQTAAASGKGQGTGGEGLGPDYGIGSTNLDAGKGYEVENKTGMSRQADRDSRWTEEFIKLYDPRSIATKAQDQKVRGKLGEGRSSGSVPVPGSPGTEAPRVAATRALLDYTQAQKDSLANEDIPPGYKEYVRNYFDSIEPPRK